MPSTVFDVTPEEIDATAGKIESKTNEFTRAYDSIYTAVSDLRVNYKGEASDTFNQKIESYKDDFSKAEKTLKEFTQFLREYAADLKKTENENNNKAASLSSGR